MPHDATDGREPAYAHSVDGRPTADWETLDAHAAAVADAARSFATAFDAADWGHAAGLWHDLGKLQPAFQR